MPISFSSFTTPMGLVSMGLIFATSGMSTAWRTDRTTSKMTCSTAPPRNVMEPWGQEVLSSIASAPASATFLAASTHPSLVTQLMLGMMIMSSSSFARATSSA